MSLPTQKKIKHKIRHNQWVPYPSKYFSLNNTTHQINNLPRLLYQLHNNFKILNLNIKRKQLSRTMQTMQLKATCYTKGI